MTEDDTILRGGRVGWPQVTTWVEKTGVGAANACSPQPQLWSFQVGEGNTVLSSISGSLAPSRSSESQGFYGSPLHPQCSL